MALRRVFRAFVCAYRGMDGKFHRAKKPILVFWAKSSGVWLDTTAFTALFSAATALEAFVVSDALVKDAVNPTFGLYASVKFSSALFLALFFAARNPLLGLVTMTVTLALMWIFVFLFCDPARGNLQKPPFPSCFYGIRICGRCPTPSRL